MGLTQDGFSTKTQEENRAVLVSVLQGTFPEFETDTLTPGGQLIDILAELITAEQQEALFTYQSYDRRTATGVALDRLGALIDILRDGATQSSSEGTITGTGGTAIPNLSRVRLDATNTVWEITGGPYAIPGIGAGQTIANVPLQSQDTGIIEATATTAWTIVDVVSGWAAWETTETATPGRNSQVDKDYRASQDTGLSARGQGPLRAIDANVEKVEGVVTSKTAHNPSISPVDSRGIPFKAVNTVVETSPAIPTAALKQAIALAIWNTGGGAIEAFGTDVTEIVTDTEGQAQSISFDIVSEINVWIAITVTTSDEDESITPNLAVTIQDFVAEQANIQFTGIGQNTREFEIIALVNDSGVTGVVSVGVLLSRTGFAGPFDSPEVPISIRQRADFDLTRVQVTVV